MIRTLRRRRRALASLVLGLWLFALGVAMAHACGIGSASSFGANYGVSDRQALAEPDSVPPCDDSVSQLCCREDTLAARLQPLVDAPGGQPVAPPVFIDSLLGGSRPPPSQRAISVLRAIDVPLSIRFVRLTL